MASPAYLARHATPRAPEQLKGHNCLKFMLPNGTVQEWVFAAPGAKASMITTRGSLVCDHGEGLIEAACAGLGVFQAHDYSVAEPLATGRLVEVLAEFSPPGPPISLLVAPGKRASPKVRAFIDFMLETLAERG